MDHDQKGPIRIGSMNTKVTLSDRVAASCLELALAKNLDVWCGQEWGPNRNDVMADQGRMVVWGRGRRLQRRATSGGMLFVRHTSGGEPVGLSDRFTVVDVERAILAEGRAVRPQPGTRRVEDDNDATLVTVLDHEAGGAERRILNGHLPAHVQRGKENSYRYPSDPRAAMHREAKAAIVQLAPDYAAFDTNWHNMRLPGFKSCWDGRTPLPTLGDRAIDTIYRRGGKTATRVRTFATPAREHKFVVADWLE